MLKKKLKKALKDAGLSEGLAEVINITSEDQIETIVNQIKEGGSDDNPDLDFEDILQSEAFNEFVEENGFDAVIQLSKTLQSEHDRKVTKGIKNGLDNFLKKKGGGKTKTTKGGDTNPDLEEDNNMPAWAKALTEKIDKLEKSKNQEDWSQRVKEALNKSQVLPENLKTKWGSRIVEGDIAIEKQVEALEKEYEEIHQEHVGEISGGGLPTGGSTKKGEVPEDVIESVADRII